MNTSRTIIHSLLLASTLVLAAPATAGMDSDGAYCMGKGRHFTQADSNQDGSIDKAEAQAFHDQRFRQMDANQDGKIDQQEMQAGMPRMQGMGKMGSGTGFMRADKNSDGALDRTEAEQLPRIHQNFDAIDADKDGTVTRAEVHDYMMNPQ